MNEEKCNSMLREYGPIAGRILMALLFILSGVGKVTGFEGSVGYAASAGMPMPEVAIVLAIIIEIGAGLALVVGYQVHWAAKALVVYTLVANFFFHMDFSDQMQMVAFLKNLSIIGGLLYVMTYGAGPRSMDNKQKSIPSTV